MSFCTPARTALALLLLTIGLSPAANAATFRVLIDSDNNAATGCSSGTYSGIEQILITTVDSTPQVTSVQQQTCTDGSFGLPTNLTPPPPSPQWAVGTAAPPDGPNVVETYIPFTPVAETIRLYVTSDNDGTPPDSDTLTATADGGPIVFELGFIASIPTLGEWGLLLLALCLAGAAVVMLRRRQRVAFLLLCLLAIGATAAWAAITLDGQITDWNGVQPVAVDPFGSDPSPDLRALFVRFEGGNLYFRIDTSLNQNPLITSPAAVNAAENQTAVIDVQSTDPDGNTEGAGLTYSLTGGADQALFSIVPATGVLTFNSAPDFEAPGDAGANNVYDVQVTVTDSGALTDVQNLQVTVTNVNEAPSITSSAAVSVPENQTSVIDVQSSDPDGETEGAGLTYSLTGGADQALFSIVPATGILTFNSAPDFEAPGDAGANNVYDVQVTVTDAGTLTDVQNLQVTVTSVNEAPSITSSATVSVPENQTSVVDVQSTDPEGDIEGAGLTYSLTGGADQAKFSIVPATGVLTFNSAPDFESPTDVGANNVYDVQVTVTDSGAQTGVQNLQVTVTNVNEAPSITSSATANVPENQTSAIDVQSTDPDGETEGAGLTYSLTGGADQAKFSIVPATGVLTFNVAPDFESPTDAGANNVYDVQVTVTDAGTLTGVQNLQVTVTNVNEAPSITSAAAVSVPENQTAVIDVQSTDPEGDTEGSGLAYSLTGGADQAKFSIVPATGVLTFNVAPNFESPTDVGANNVYDVQVTVTDSGTQTGVQNLQVTVTNVNEAPSITSAAAVSVPENQTAVIDVQSTDQDGDTEGAGLTYSLTGGADLAKFSIVPATGVLTFNVAPNFESPTDVGANNVYDVQVTVTDSGTLTGVQNLQVTVTNVNEAPSITSPATVSVPENQTSVINVQSTDPDGETEGAGLTYSLTGGADLAKFSIVPATGVLTFNVAPNFESPTDVGANNVYDVQVTVTDAGTLTAVQNLQVTVTNVNEAPSITSSASVSVPENQTSVIDVQSNDPDGDTEGAGLSYSLTGGADLAKFSIVPATGVLTFNVAPNFESPTDVGANNVYDVQVTVTDSGTLTGVQNLQVTVTNLNEAPSIISPTAVSTPENQTSVIDVQSTDPDGETEGAGLTYSLTGGADQVKFSIVPTTGVLTFNVAPNFEIPTDVGANNVYDVQVTVTDSGTLTAVQNLQVTVTDVPEPPMATNDSFDTIGNTELRVDRPAGSTPNVKVTTALSPPNKGVLDNDVDSDTGQTDTLTVDAITSPACGDAIAPFVCSTTNGGTVTMESDGSFSYVPPAGNNANDTFTYRARDVAGLISTAQVTLRIFERVWYVKNDATAGGLGRSNDPFDTLAEAQTASVANDYIFVHFGDGTTTGQNAGIALKNGQHLIGEFAGLTVAVPGPGNFNGTPLPANVGLVTQPAGTACSGGPCRPLIDRSGAGNNAVSATNVIPAEIVGLSLSGGANAIDLTTGVALPASASLLIKDNVVRSAGAEGMDINLNAGTSGTLTLDVQGNSWTTTAANHVGNAFDARTAAAGAALRLSFSNNTGITSSATGVFVDSSGGGSITITGFANNSVHQNTLGTGISITGAKFDAVPGTVAYDQVSGGTTVIGASGDGVGGAGMALSNVSGDLAFTDLDIFADGGAGLRVTGTGAVNVGAGTGTRVTVGAGVAIFEAIGGPAVDVTSATIDLQPTSIKSTNSPTTGVALNSVTGTFSAGSGSSISNITSAAGTAFQVGGSNATVSYAGTINTTTGTGVSLTGNTGSTISFTGALTLSTGTNPAFVATGGGTVSSTDTTSTLTTTTGTALNVANTTIGASGLKFRSITAGTAASGPASGIILNTTGAGVLTVTGDGTTNSCKTGTTTCSGGTVQKATADGISLTSAKADLSLMWIKNNANSGIKGTTVSGFKLTDCLIQNNTNSTGEQAGILINDLSDANSQVTRVEVSGSTEDNVRIHNSAVTGTATLSNCTIKNNSTASGNNGVFFQTNTTGNLTGTVKNSTFSGNRTISLSADSGDGSTLSATFMGNTITAGSPNQGNQGIQVSRASTSTLTFNIDGNTVTGMISTLINVFSGSGPGTATGDVKNNICSGTGVGGNQFGIRVFNSGTLAVGQGTINVNVANNTVNNIDNAYPIFGESSNSSGSGGLLKMAVTGNNASVVAGGTALDSIRVQARNTSTVCAKVSGNTTNSGGPGFYGLQLRQANTSTFNLEGLTLGAQVEPTVHNYLVSQNPAAATVSSDGTVTGTITGVATNSCGITP